MVLSVGHCVLDSQEYMMSFQVGGRCKLPHKSMERDKQELLEELLLDGMAGGASIPLTREFWKELKAKASEIAARHQAKQDV